MALITMMIGRTLMLFLELEVGDRDRVCLDVVDDIPLFRSVCLYDVRCRWKRCCESCKVGQCNFLSKFGGRIFREKFFNLSCAS